MREKFTHAVKKLVDIAFYYIIKEAIAKTCALHVSMLVSTLLLA